MNFEKLTKEQQAIEICKDVIKQVKSNKYIAQQTVYCQIDTNMNDNDDVKSNFNKFKCDVCALGSLFMSHIHFNNSYTFEHANSNYEAIRDEVTKYFSREQMCLIETAFEEWNEYYCEDNYIIMDDGIFSDIEFIISDKFNINLLDKAKNFNKKRFSPSENLINIMENIIKNNGIFVP